MTQLNAYMDAEYSAHPTSHGTLDTLNFAVKDVFNLKGVTSSAGNPEWLRTHKPSKQNAEAIDLLLEEGAMLRGTTHTDELMYSLNGENAHYGTPLNPSLPGHIPGGSSSGSASAAAAGDVDFSIGTDTGGSVRIPAAYCGIFGMRPTHGAVPIDGVIPLAPSFDTVGWMAQRVHILEEVGRVLLPETDTDGDFSRVLLPEDAWSLADKTCVAELTPMVSDIKNKLHESDSMQLSIDGLPQWKEIFRILQAYEVWEAHGEWVKANEPNFGPGIADRFDMAQTITKEMYNHALQEQVTVREHVRACLPANTLMVIPTVPGTAPEVGLPEEQIELRRSQTLQLSCIAGLSGVPQMTVPIKTKQGPLGLSFIAGASQDRRLLAFVRKLMAN